MAAQFHIDTGRPLPLGASEHEDGVNFAVFSRNATSVWLELFAEPEDAEPLASIKLDPWRHRTGDIWHVWVKGVSPGRLYAYRADGPYDPEKGHRFNRRKLLLDPYATALVGTAHWDYSRATGYDPASPEADLAASTLDNARWMPKCRVTSNHFDWQGDRPQRHAWVDTIVYEIHVRGFTIHPSAHTAHPGTFLGVIDKIPYLKKLGITAVELMPIHEFNPSELTRQTPLTGERRRNYWGYSTAAFLAPKEGYGTMSCPGCQVAEFKTMVRELHRAGIEVILDVVFNHTAEGDELGPTLNFRGLENSIYYMLDEERGRRFYRNFSGCGNTSNCNHPVVKEYILDCLHYWVVEMHVDGFRFDLASILGRDQEGDILTNPPLLERIAEDPVLRDVKLIAEAWDAAGAYQVGSFPGKRWTEWNGRFRDDVRRFWRGDAGMVGPLASRLCGSADVYQHSGKAPVHSINFVTCHDGFTLNDLVSYEQRHNEANGENNRDGEKHNFSSNHGVEGPTDDPGVEALRVRQIKNFTATLLVSRGVPMVLAGDEFRRTQKGNNNAYCQDNEVSWTNWELLRQNVEIFRFARRMIAFRKRHGVLRAERFYESGEIGWFGPSGGTPDWNGPSGTLGCLLFPEKEKRGRRRPHLCVLFNAEKRSAEFSLPDPPSGHIWHVAVDTALDPPDDILPAGKEKPVSDPGRYLMQQLSMVILASDAPKEQGKREIAVYVNPPASPP